MVHKLLILSTNFQKVKGRKSVCVQNPPHIKRILTLNTINNIIDKVPELSNIQQKA